MLSMAMSLRLSMASMVSEKKILKEAMASMNEKIIKTK
jgi:hypothetical protein